MVSLKMEATTDKDEWEAMNDIDEYQKIRLRYSQHVQKIYCIHKELILIMFIYIFASGGMLIYSICNFKFLEAQVKLNSKMQRTSQGLAISDLLQEYNKLKNISDSNTLNLPRNPISYLPYSPQSNVPLLSLTSGGWINCYLSSYGDEATLDISIIFNTFCTAPYLMLGCKRRNEKDIQVLAWGGRKHVLYHTENEFDFQVAQGTKWIYHNSSYIGFAEPHDNVVIGALDWNQKKDGQYFKVKCDTYSSLASFYGDYQNNSKRLCWPIVERIRNDEGNKQNNKKIQSFMGKGGTCHGNAWKKSDEWERLIFEREKI